MQPCGIRVLSCVVWPKQAVRARLAVILSQGVRPRQVLSVRSGAAILCIVRGVRPDEMYRGASASALWFTCRVIDRAARFRAVKLYGSVHV